MQGAGSISGRLNFEIDAELEPSLIASRAGVASLIEAYRLSGTAAVIERMATLKKRQRGLTGSEMVLDLQCRKPQKIATLDIDATVIHSSKRAAKRACDGERGDQPAGACRAGSSGRMRHGPG